jgi:GT2 family glycosyltransferase
MEMIEFLNRTGRIIVLPGPNNERVQFSKFQKKILPVWYSKYVPKYLQEVRKIGAQPENVPVELRPVRPKQITMKTAAVTAQQRMDKIQERKRKQKQLSVARAAAISAKGVQRQHKGNHAVARPRILGSASAVGSAATKQYQEIIQKLKVPISNDIGVGIMSYNRLDSIQRLVNSIRKNTDLNRTTVFISDESTDQKVKDYLKTITDMVVLDNKNRIGIAGNTNRLMRCLARFQYKIIMNDDIEIMARGWENVYANAMGGTGIHHFCFRQAGVYGAKDHDGAVSTVGGFKISTIKDKPQGAIIAYDHEAFKKVGYFDEGFGIYGMEHVDWSNRIIMSGIQKPGFHDIIGSDKFFKLHNTKSAVEDRSKHLSASRRKYKELKHKHGRIHVDAGAKSEVSEGVTYIVPFRGMNRANAIKVVLLNLKAQRFPIIEIIMVEQDFERRNNMKSLDSVKYLLAKSYTSGQPFTKSLAFNQGVKNASFRKLILHDADMIVQDDYTIQMSRLLDVHDGVHIGKTVHYMSNKSTDQIYAKAMLTGDMVAERVVGYFEGGSLGCLRDNYIKIGGFNEAFIGYGCEDCEFFARLAASPKFFNNRSVNLIHLWHGRTQGWKEHHNKNKLLESKLYSTPMAERIKNQRRVFLEKYKI